MATLHDETVARLAAAIKEIVERDSRRVVATGVRWQVMEEFPNCVETFDIAVLPAESGLAVGKTLVPPREVPTTLIDVITPECDTESEFYDKPDWLLQTSISEYCLLDPTNEVMRPYLNAARKNLTDGWDRLKTCSHGTFFSRCGFRIDANLPAPKVSPCGPARIEEKLVACRAIRANVVLKGRVPDAGLDEQIRKLEEKLSRPRKRGSE